MQPNHNHCLKFVALALSIFLSLVLSASAQDLSYDRYAPVYKKTPSAPSTAKKMATRFLIAPFELVKWPIDQGLYLTERYDLDRKTKYIYDEMQDYGVTPRFGISALNSYYFGGTLDLVRLLRQQERFPNLIAKGSIDYNYLYNFEVGAEVGLNRILDTGFFTKGFFKYDRRLQEHFYGIGPNTSRGDGYVYGLETTKLEYVAGYSPNPTLFFEGKFGYRNVNVTSGKDGGRGQIGTGIFTADRTPGFNGDEIITLGTEIRQDTRNRKELSTKGGLRRFAFSWNEGVSGSRASYFKYEAELAQYLALWSERRVLVFRFWGEINSEIHHKYVPFYDMPQLGGYGTYPQRGETLRSYDYNRFYDDSALLFNLEYRYTIMDYRDWKLDAVFFNDLGQVFDRISKFRFSNFKDSYGLGFRLSLAENILLAFEVAHGNEGTNLYVKSNAPF